MSFVNDFDTKNLFFFFLDLYVSDFFEKDQLEVKKSLKTSFYLQTFFAFVYIFSVLKTIQFPFQTYRIIKSMPKSHEVG